MRSAKGKLANGFSLCTLHFSLFTSHLEINSLIPNPQSLAPSPCSHARPGQPIAASRAASARGSGGAKPGRGVRAVVPSSGRTCPALLETVYRGDISGVSKASEVSEISEVCTRPLPNPSREPGEKDSTCQSDRPITGPTADSRPPVKLE